MPCARRAISGLAAITGMLLSGGPLAGDDSDGRHHAKAEILWDKFGIPHVLEAPQEEIMFAWRPVRFGRSSPLGTTTIRLDDGLTRAPAREVGVTEAISSRARPA